MIISLITFVALVGGGAPAGGPFFTPIASACVVQEQEVSKRSDDIEASIVKGRLVQHEDKKFKISFSELNPTFDQRVEMPSRSLPPNWQQMTIEQKQQWEKEFIESEAGKAFLAERKRRLEAAESFKIQMEDNGNFVIYDVPEGTYGLRGKVEKEIESKTYVVEVFAQVVITEKVEEVLLDPIAVTTTRLVKRTEKVPNFEVETFDGKRKINDEMIAGRPVLINFWALESPPSMEFAKTIQKSFKTLKESHKLHLVSVCVGSDRNKALKLVQKNLIRGWHGYADDWEHPAVNEFGVRVIPAIFLIDTDGKLLMTNGDFRAAFQVKDAELTKILTDAIEGKMVPTPMEDEKDDDGSSQKEEDGSESK